MPTTASPRRLLRAEQELHRLVRAVGLALLLAWGPMLAAGLALRWAILPHIDQWRPGSERPTGRGIEALPLPTLRGLFDERSLLADHADRADRGVAIPTDKRSSR